MRARVAFNVIVSIILCFALVGSIYGCAPTASTTEEQQKAQQASDDPMLATFNVDGFVVEGLEDISQLGGYSAKIVGFNGIRDAAAVLYVPINVTVAPEPTAAQASAGTPAPSKNLAIKGVSGISGYKVLAVTDLPDSVAVNTPNQALYDRNVTYNSVDSNGDGSVDRLEVLGDKALKLPDNLLATHPLLTKLKYDKLPATRFGLPVFADNGFVDSKIAAYTKALKAAKDSKGVQEVVAKLDKFERYLNAPTAYATQKIKALTKTINTRLTNYEKAAAAPKTVTLTINMGKRGVNCPELYFVKDGQQTLVQAVSKWIIDGKEVSSNVVFDKYFFADGWDAAKHTVTVVMATTLKAGTYSVKFTGGGEQKTLGNITIAGADVAQSFTY